MIQAFYYLLSPVTWLVFGVGLILGSFFNVCISRLPQGRFWQDPWSRCPGCKSRILPQHNIPLVSYFFILRGRAACCGMRISFQYPLVEMLTGFLLVWVYWSFPFYDPFDHGIEFKALLRFAHAGVFTSLLLICSAIDCQKMIIPDLVSIPMIAVSPMVAWLHPDLTIVEGLIGAFSGAALLYGIAWIYWLVRREVGLGFGDVKLIAAIGGWLGYQAIVPTVLFGSILGAAFGIGMMAVTRTVDLKLAIPFGPFLAIGATLHLLAGRFIYQWLYGV